MEKDEVVDTNLLMEGKGKLTTIFNLIEYPKALERELEILWPKKEDFYKSIEIMNKLLKEGKPVPVIDVLIASMCINRGLKLLTRDKHFRWIKEIEPHFKVKII